MKLQNRLQPMRGLMDMTPLIDVVFLLLIFFILSSSFILQPGIRVDAPRSSFGPGSPANSLILSVMLEPERRDVNGQVLPRQPVLFFNDQIMSAEDFKKLLPQYVRGRLNQSLILKADKEVPVGMTIDIMNICLANGMTVVLATQRDDGSGS
jgi:biopolymer transport protein ExbD